MNEATTLFSKLYGAFERLAAVVLLIGIGVVVVLAIESFGHTILLTFDMMDAPLNYGKFETLFDRILAALIALELAHSVRQMVAGEHGLSQVRTVIVIGVLALVRKLIVLDVETTSGLFLLGLATAIVALGALLALVHWIERGRGGGGDAAGAPAPGQIEPGPPPRRRAA